LKGWRHSLEAHGVYAFKDTFKDLFVSGFCLYDLECPVIMLNNGASFTRQLFTLLHELAHLLLGVDGITDVSDEYLQYLDAPDRDIEVACNKIAAAVLVPYKAFKDDVADFKSQGMQSVSNLAEKYSVSREVILRRLLDLGLLSRTLYTEKASEWNADFARSQKKRSSKGNYYLTKLAYLGEGFAKLAVQSYRQGRIAPTDAATHLNMNARNLSNIERYLRW
jgi:Zn-dependent peptidase ImmA (M78 family)